MTMPPWRLRDFHEDDLDQAISVWDQSRSRDEAHPVFGVSEVISAVIGSGAARAIRRTQPLEEISGAKQ